MAESDTARRKRVLRTPSETVREKADKVRDLAAQPKKRGKIRSFFAWLFTPLKVFGWIAHRPPLKQVGHGLRWFFSLRLFSLLAFLLGLRYLRDSWQELKLVTWPSAKLSRQLTTAVVIFAVIFGGLIYVADLGLNKLFKEVVIK